MIPERLPLGAAVSVRKWFRGNRWVEGARRTALHTRVRTEEKTVLSAVLFVCFCYF